MTIQTNTQQVNNNPPLYAMGQTAVEQPNQHVGSTLQTPADGSNNYVYNYSNLYLHIEKTNYLEDRAVIFSDLMSRSITKDYYNDGTPINKKAKLISSQIKEYFNILSSE